MHKTQKEKEQELLKKIDNWLKTQKPKKAKKGKNNETKSS